MALSCGFLGGVLASAAHKWTLLRVATQLRCDVEELKERLYVELKKRASLAARSKKDFDEEVFRAAEKTPQIVNPQKGNATWWWPGQKPEIEKSDS